MVFGSFELDKDLGKKETHSAADMWALVMAVVTERSDLFSTSNPTSQAAISWHTDVNRWITQIIAGTNLPSKSDWLFP